MSIQDILIIHSVYNEDLPRPVCIKKIIIIKTERESHSITCLGISMPKQQRNWFDKPIVMLNLNNGGRERQREILYLVYKRRHPR